uniref:Putative secreted peptide n=1 Tax=Anopheles braziliensis TaxID=58242 RepID=A0A2M3ZTV3_9DIPT
MGFIVMLLHHSFLVFFSSSKIHGYRYCVYPMFERIIRNVMQRDRVFFPPFAIHVCLIEPRTEQTTANGHGHVDGGFRRWVLVVVVGHGKLREIRADD